MVPTAKSLYGSYYNNPKIMLLLKLMQDQFKHFFCNEFQRHEYLPYCKLPFWEDNLQLNFPNYVMTEKNDNVYMHSYETYNNEGMHKTYVTGRYLFHFIDILQVFEINLVKTFIRLSCHSRLIKTVKLIRLIIKCFKKKRLPSFNKFYFDLPTGPSFQYLLPVLVQHYIT